MDILKNRYTEIKQKLFDARYKFLNEAQREAVYTNEGPLLILAGAGSGKTTVLVNRVAFIIKYGNAYFGGADFEAEISRTDLQTLETVLEHADSASPEELDEVLARFAFDPCPAYSILSITFTNKAANEMKLRLSELAGDGAADIWAGTFHSVCVRILRRYIDKIGYESSFTIYDTDDVRRLITAVMKDLNISDEDLPVRAVAYAISRHKDKLEYPEDISPGNNTRERNIYKIYKEYQKRIKSSNAVDFDDIIALTVKLLKTHSEVREYYNGKLKYILVDEYQDTNYAQYYLISLLSQKYNNIMAVGDDDQSIYKFRGATIENILSFNQRFKDVKIIKLEQNYRSTKVILDAANGIIQNNTGRMGKDLWTARDGGAKVIIKENNDQTDEANYIIEEIGNLVAAGHKYKDFAVLYRVNAQSANIETVFAKSVIPYRMLGGIRFYERKEIKDILAYLCLVNNPSDAVRLKRIINEPKRGIGETTITAVEQLAAEENKSMFEIIQNAESYPSLSRSFNKLKGFAELVSSLIETSGKVSLPEFFEFVFEESGYRNMLEEAGQKGDRYDGKYKFGARAERFEKSEEKDRLDNVKELISQAITYMQTKESTGETASLTGFLEEIALISDIDKYDETADAVALMTIHSSKGLEFPVVFLSGMEENVFPSMHSANEPEQLEEERRLAYVALTRAKERVYLTYAKERLIYGRSGYNRISRFAEEIPGHTAEFVKVPESERRIRTNVPGFGQKKYPLKVSPTSEFATAYTTASSACKTDLKSGLAEFKKGDVVEHANFGEGMIISATDMKGDMLYEVTFDSVGTKKMMGTFAKFKLKEKQG